MSLVDSYEWNGHIFRVGDRVKVALKTTSWCGVIDQIRLQSPDISPLFRIRRDITGRYRTVFRGDLQPEYAPCSVPEGQP